MAYTTGLGITYSPFANDPLVVLPVPLVGLLELYELAFMRTAWMVALRTALRF